MKTRLQIFCLAGILLYSCRPGVREPAAPPAAGAEEKLSAWSEDSRSRLIGWMETVTDSASGDFIPVADRIAVFDNDGTLWPEQPVPSQVVFAIDYLKALAPGHPEWRKDPVLNGVLDGNLEPLKKEGVGGLVKLINASHTGMTTREFEHAVSAWIDTARDSKFDRLYKEVIYLPMTQLLDYLRDNSFTIFIVSGGGADFMRAWTEEVYGIPPYQVIGSYGEVKYEVADGTPVITKIPGPAYFDDKEAKPAAIHRFIGKVPVFCGGNSDGDQAMMQYTGSSKYKSLCVLLHHTDSVREYKYDTHTLSGHLETALVEAAEKGWLVVDMKKDFKEVFDFE